ncbi:MAG: LamG-like jellyroll fold domain-containing protein [Thermoguttaceae bacterium]
MLQPSSIIGPPGGWGRQKPPCGVGLDPGHPLTRGLVAFWTLNEGAGRVVRSSRGVFGALTGNAKWANTSRGVVADFDGPTPGTSALATGVYCSLGTAERPDFSMFALIYPRSLAYYGSIMSDQVNVADSSIRTMFYFSAAKGLRVDVGNGTSYTVCVADDILVTNSWQAVGFTRRNGVGQFYLNGLPVGTPTACTTLAPAAVVPWSLGRMCDSGFTTGYANMQLAAAGIWNVGLSSESMRLLYALPYCMHEGSATPMRPEGIVRPLIDGSLIPDSQLMGATA